MVERIMRESQMNSDSLIVAPVFFIVATNEFAERHREVEASEQSPDKSVSEKG